MKKRWRGSREGARMLAVYRDRFNVPERWRCEQCGREVDLEDTDMYWLWQPYVVIGRGYCPLCGGDLVVRVWPSPASRGH